MAEALIIKKKAKPAFKGYRGFTACICVPINDEVVHGIPSAKRFLKHGDIVGLDFGVVYDDFFGDSAVTIPIGDIPPDVENLLRITEQSLYAAIETLTPGNYLSDVGAAIQKLADQHHFGIVREFCGHGIGSALRS